MIKAKCIHKFRNNQKQIVGYKLTDNQGNIKDIKAKELKLLIKNKEIDVVNLKLTSDNRLVDSEIRSDEKPKAKENIYDIISNSIIKSDLGRRLISNREEIRIKNHRIDNVESYNDWYNMICEDCPYLGILKCGIDTDDITEYDENSDWFQEYTHKNSIEALRNEIASARLRVGGYLDIDWYLVLTEENIWVFQIMINSSKDTDSLDEGTVYSLEDRLEAKDLTSILEKIKNTNWTINDIIG